MVFDGRLTKREPEPLISGAITGLFLMADSFTMPLAKGDALIA